MPVFCCKKRAPTSEGRGCEPESKKSAPMPRSVAIGVDRATDDVHDIAWVPTLGSGELPQGDDLSWCAGETQIEIVDQTAQESCGCFLDPRGESIKSTSRCVDFHLVPEVRRWILWVKDTCCHHALRMVLVVLLEEVVHALLFARVPIVAAIDGHECNTLRAVWVADEDHVLEVLSPTSWLVRVRCVVDAVTLRRPRGCWRRHRHHHARKGTHRLIRGITTREGGGSGRRCNREGRTSSDGAHRSQHHQKDRKELSHKSILLVLCPLGHGLRNVRPRIRT